LLKLWTIKTINFKKSILQLLVNKSKIVTMKGQAHYNANTGKSTYSRPARNIDVRPDTVVNNDAPKAYGQDLANKKGASGAAKLMFGATKSS